MQAELVDHRGEHACIRRRDRAPLVEDDVALLELAVEERREHFAQSERRADVVPGVLVDLAEHEGAAVRALVVEHVGARDVGLVVDDERAALAADEVLRLVEAQRAETAEAPERPPLVSAEQPVGVVFDDRDVAAVDRGLDAVDVAADPRVVHGHDRAHRVVIGE